MNDSNKPMEWVLAIVIATMCVMLVLFAVSIIVDQLS